ncbi:hypothetical protein [Gallaecimonas sp. GXIMD4217]|uniref:hypothetical protein n=1 Tax=Gallaecimonas sp. GXIMD4217 TaxID=3131927 RepID=UPI00311AC7C1
MKKIALLCFGALMSFSSQASAPATSADVRQYIEGSFDTIRELQQDTYFLYWKMRRCKIFDVAGSGFHEYAGHVLSTDLDENSEFYKAAVKDMTAFAEGKSKAFLDDDRENTYVQVTSQLRDRYQETVAGRCGGYADHAAIRAERLASAKQLEFSNAVAGFMINDAHAVWGKTLLLMSKVRDCMDHSALTKNKIDASLFFKLASENKKRYETLYRQQDAAAIAEVEEYALSNMATLTQQALAKDSQQRFDRFLGSYNSLIFEYLGSSEKCQHSDELVGWLR